MDASLSQGANAPASISIQDAPEVIAEVDVSITGGGVSIFETVGPGTDAMVFELPVGREHDLTIDTTNFIGRRSFVLPARGAQVDVRMREKLFVPDRWNSTLVKIDDMGGGNWATEQVTDDQGTSLDPDDAAVGPDGRIYVLANEDIVAFDSVEEPDTELIGVAYTGARGLAIDGERGIIYYAEDDTELTLPVLEARGLNGSYEHYEVLDDVFAVAADIWGLTVDDAGNVYVSGLTRDPLRPAVRKISRSDWSVAWTVTLDLPGDAQEFEAEHIDVTHTTGRLFVTNPAGFDGQKIVELDPGTGRVENGFGRLPVDPDNPEEGEFYGPRRFVATGNAVITLIDEDPDGLYDRLVQFRPDRSAWKTYGSTGYSGDEGTFGFFLAGT